MLELLVLFAVGMLAAFLVGAVILHVLLGLILLPFKLGLAVLKGLLFAAFALPVAAVVLAVVVFIVSVALLGAGVCLLVGLL
jgi:hypothetical protein